jgi:hypothetical protein
MCNEIDRSQSCIPVSSVAPRDLVCIGKMELADHIDQLVSHRPGMTELALAKSLFGRVGYQQRVNSICRCLFREGHIDSALREGLAHPFLKDCCALPDQMLFVRPFPWRGFILAVNDGYRAYKNQIGIFAFGVTANDFSHGMPPH